MNSISSLIFLALAVSAVLVLAACGASDYEGRDGGPADGLKITVEEYSDTWPFDAEAGTLECAGAGAAVFHHGGDSYALNNLALDQNYTPLAKIRKNHGELGRQHYDLAVESGDLSPNINTYDRFLDSYQSTYVYFTEFPRFVDLLGGDLEAMADLALTLC